MFDVVFSAAPTQRLGTVPTRILGEYLQASLVSNRTESFPAFPDLRQHLEAEISARLCSFVMRGVMEPSVLLGLTVATVKSPRCKVRRRGMLGTPHPVRDSRLEAESDGLIFLVTRKSPAR
jgi:hypothetical protein